MGYCYYGNYAQYFEVGRVEALRSLGISYKSMEDSGYMLPVSEFKVNYFLILVRNMAVVAETNATKRK
jgi:acyl-CoA thioester hydrolase